MKKILIVEDDHLVATAYRRRFKDAGWNVQWAPDGVEGIKAVGTTKPDVVLLDLLMPRLDGIEVLKYIRANPDLKNLPVVVFSNSYMTNLIENAWRAGADQCIMKASTTPEILFDAIERAMQLAAERNAATVGKTQPTWPGTPQVCAPFPTLPLMSHLGMTVIVEPKRRPNSPGARPANMAPVQPLAYPGGLESPSAPAPEMTPASTESSTSGNEAAGQSPAPSADPEFQAEIRQLFVSGSTAKLEALRTIAQGLVEEGGAGVAERLQDLFRKIHSMTGNAAVADCPAIAHYVSTFEAFLQELQEKPRFINASTIRTIFKGIEFLALLFQHALAEPPPNLSRRVLVADGDPMSGQAIALTLEKAGLRTHLASDPVEAMTLGSSEEFTLVVTATDLPGMSGFDVCSQLQTLPGCANVPVLLVVAEDDFERQVKSDRLGEYDIIARPFLIIELTLKAHTLMEAHRFKTHFASAA